jgi:enamine deaminase RidA (YjgF/YER057c/UK114 family)
MERKLISSGSAFEKMIGYSRAVVDGEWIFVSGTTGFDYETMSISNDIVEQTEQCFKNIMSALKQADSTLNDVVRVMYILPNTEDFEECWPVLRKNNRIKGQPTIYRSLSGRHDPAMTLG